MSNNFVTLESFFWYFLVSAEIILLAIAPVRDATPNGMLTGSPMNVANVATLDIPVATLNPLQSGGMKGKSVMDNLFITRGLINHAVYLNKELWITFYDIENALIVSGWRTVYINSLWDLGVKDDILYLIHLLNTKASVTIETPMSDTHPLLLPNLVKQGTVLESVLNNCSLDRFSQESFSYQFGSVEIKTSLFVDDISDPNSCKTMATLSNKVLEDIQHQKRVTFSAEKCELLLVNRKECDSLPLNSDKINSVQRAPYLGDLLNEKGNYLDLCEDRADRAKTTVIELCALSKGINFGHRQIESLLILYKPVFVSRLIYNCEGWSGLTIKKISILRTAQLNFLRCMLEVPKGTPTAALYLELGILPINFEIEIKQLLYLKRILDKKNDDPVQLCYHEMLKFSEEANWANDVIGLRKKYNLPLHDVNVKNMGVKDWKWIVKSTIYREAF